ncbi:hypothetical protein [Marinicauda salina]|uniref:hypothetical protein n=1 Tax=Marinicauda salina TaxID=2135793 RepID=UPI0013048316|nr:hypothetical protein [Marinicauda salina]
MTKTRNNASGGSLGLILAAAALVFTLLLFTEASAGSGVHADFAVASADAR